MLNLAIGLLAAVVTVPAGDGTSIQKAIDEVAAQGGGRVVVPAGEYRSPSLRLRSNVELYLSKGALLRGGTRSEDYFDFPTDVCAVRPEKSGRVFIYAWDAENIAITGEGIIDGRAKVAAGLVPECVPDAKGHIKIVENFVCDYIRTGKTDWWQDKMPKLYSGEVENPEIRDLLRKLQERLLPVTVEGDIHWGVNRTKEGWLVWLINNNGVTKFFGEPEDLDPKATSVVRITYKATGRTYTARVKPGDWTAVRIADGDFREPVQVR